MTTRRAALAAAAALAAPRAASAADFPSRTVTWVVPGSAGSVLDVAARTIAIKMVPRLGQNVIIDNRTGAGGTIAAEYAARAAPDGHTIFYGAPSFFAIAPLMIPNLRYDALRDFAPVRGTGASANIVVTGMNRPWKTVPELVAFARANPGKVTYAAGVGTATQAATLLFAEKARIELTHVPYSVFGQIMGDLAGERVDLAFDFPLSSLPFVRDSKLRALAVSSDERLVVAPEVPTLAETGLPGAGMVHWAGVYVPAATPPAAVAKLSEALRAALGDPEVKAYFDRTGTIVWEDVDAPRLASLLEEEIQRMRRLLGQR